MKPISTLLAVILLAGNYGIARPVFADPPTVDVRKDWEDLEDETAGFAIEIPTGQVREEVQSLDTELGETDLYLIVVDREPHAYLVGYSDFPEVLAVMPAQTLLMETKAGLTSNAKRRLADDREIEIDGYPGFDLFYEATDGLTYRHRIVLVDRRLYQIIAATSEVEDNEDLFEEWEDDADRFIDSFELVED